MNVGGSADEAIAKAGANGGKRFHAAWGDDHPIGLKRAARKGRGLVVRMMNGGRDTFQLFEGHGGLVRDRGARPLTKNQVRFDTEELQCL